MSGNKIIIDYNRLENIELSGIDTKDYPDFCDSYITTASYGDRELTDDELDVLNDDVDFVYSEVMRHFYG